MRVIIIALACVFLASCASTGSKTISGTQGWKAVGADIWSTHAGVLSTKSEAGKSYFVSPLAYKNYKLELEFLPDAEVNSGVFINCDNNTAISSKNCYEANISDNHKKPEFRTGSIVRHAVPGSKVNTIGKWNKLVFVSSQGKITLEINGVKTAEITSEKHPSGYIGLQRFKGGVIQFRNVYITEL